MKILYTGLYKAMILQWSAKMKNLKPTIFVGLVLCVAALILMLLLNACTSQEQKQYDFTLNGVKYKLDDCFVSSGLVTYEGGMVKMNLIYLSVVNYEVKTDGQEFIGSSLTVTNENQRTYQYKDPSVWLGKTKEYTLMFKSPAAGFNNKIVWHLQGNDYTSLC